MGGQSERDLVEFGTAKPDGERRMRLVGGGREATCVAPDEEPGPVVFEALRALQEGSSAASP